MFAGKYAQTVIAQHAAHCGITISSEEDNNDSDNDVQYVASSPDHSSSTSAGRSHTDSHSQATANSGGFLQPASSPFGFYTEREALKQKTCPICSDSFPSSMIEAHANLCLQNNGW